MQQKRQPEASTSLTKFLCAMNPYMRMLDGKEPFTTEIEVLSEALHRGCMQGSDDEAFDWRKRLSDFIAKETS